MNTSPDTLNRLRKRTYGYTASRNDWDQRCPNMLLSAWRTPTGDIRLRESPLELPGVESFMLVYQIPDAMKFMIQFGLVDPSDIIALGLCSESYAVEFHTDTELQHIQDHYQPERTLSQHPNAVEIFGTVMLTLDGHMMMFKKERPTGLTTEIDQIPGGGFAHALRSCVTILNDHLSDRP